MTRPAFLLLTVVACLLGTAIASSCGCGLDMPLALGSTVVAAMAHALGNVINDQHDARNGADAANTQGVFPFTGGSRLIQNGTVTEQHTADLAKALFVLLIPAGLLIAVQAGPGILLLGAAGLLLAWAYSAPPLQLMSRGMGEFAVALAWFGVVVGADYVQRRHFFLIPASAGLGFALMVAALLVINGVPDAKADASVGKRTLVVRLGTRGATMMYGALVLAAHAWLAISVWLLIPPIPALWGLVSLPLSLTAWVLLIRHADQPQRLKPALALTVAATLTHGLGMAWGFAHMSMLR
ncbi:prenyltransferase [Hydrogenophaga sp. PAMC20947]|uniref:prenyltransferase n=1 Tax=Hydrogenophaga sp. PAMC20947 TaxID=2565558 RepID=UPI00109DAF7A|nr:prenyltransferase [Hydrogenophaga sp. PAMC20947]QCB47610.1 prenyltransferase [Hydrogenophaga sp. PAMC20947]